MKAIPVPIEGPQILTPLVFRDHRGVFFESYNKNKFSEILGQDAPEFVQDNHSISYYGVLRGLHFQFGAFSQAKLVRILRGRVLDVIVDIRQKSPTFGQHLSVELSAENRKQLFIPRGFAHGFVTLSDYAEFAYKCDNFYNRDFEAGVHYKDPKLGIDWKLPEKDLVTSEKDKKLPFISEIDYDFE